MDSELVSFRVDSTLRKEALSVCASLGIELNDYLRMCLTRLIAEKRLPVRLDHVSGPASQRGPQQGSDRLWKSIDGAANVEAALIVLGRYVARQSEKLAVALSASQPDHGLVEHLTSERSRAAVAAQQLQADDAAAAAEVLITFREAT